MKALSCLILVILLFSGCARLTVHQEDTDSWKNIPVEALDMHPIFLTMPVVKTVTNSGVEIRDYVNKANISNCVKLGGAQSNNMQYVRFQSFQNCSSQVIGCDNIFYIKDGKVLEYTPTGRCYTNESVRPQAGYDRFNQLTK